MRRPTHGGPSVTDHDAMPATPQVAGDAQPPAPPPAEPDRGQRWRESMSAAPAPAALVRAAAAPAREEGRPVDHAVWVQRSAQLARTGEGLTAELTRLQGQLDHARAHIRPGPTDSEQRSRALRSL